MTSPAAEVRSFAVTIPAGTAITSPYTQDIAFPPRIVDAVHWKVPPGPCGLMGWQLTMNDGIPVIPYGGGWIVTDNDSDTWPLINQPDSGAWEVTGYNSDIYDHTVYLDFLLTMVGGGQLAGASPQLVNVTAPAGGTTPGTVGFGGTSGGITVPPVSIPPITVTTPVVTIPPPPPVTQPTFGDVTVPATRGDRVQAAIAKLAAAGLRYKTVPDRDPKYEYAVRAQSPLGGKRVPYNSVVTLDVIRVTGK